MLNKVNTNIMQIEAKDIFRGVEVKKGNYKRYKASLDHSLEAIKIAEFSTRENEFYMVDNKQYNNSVISVTFKYSVKDADGKTVVKTKDLREELYEKGFDITFISDNVAVKPKQVHYLRFKRSSGSSRVGKCLFIREDLYEKMMTWSYMDICHELGVPINLSAIEAYIALTTSSIIDTISGIKKENILIIDEHIDKFTDTVMATKVVKEKYKDKDGQEKERDRLKTEKDEVEIKNNIWDGQCLLEDGYIFGTAPSDKTQWVNGKYADKSMLLLRNRMFKGACLNTNIKKFFADAGITKIEELNGFTMATDISQIKLICTKSCIKYDKFGKLENWLNLLEDTWGVVKYDKKTHHMMGKYVSTHYQLLNTVRFNREETVEFLKPTMEYLGKLLNDPRVMRNHLKMRNDGVEIDDINSTDDFIITMMGLNDKFTKTPMYSEFRGDIRKSFIEDIRKGHTLISGNYSVLFGNVMEMLKATIKDKNNPYYFSGNSVLNKGEIHCRNFKYGIDLLGCRSPHVTMSNLLIAKNVECRALDTYFNLSNQIVCVNSIKENLLERLSSCDFDSDQLLLSDCELLISKIKDNYNKFLVPTSLVEPDQSSQRKNTPEDKCELDIKTSVNKIGEIINLSCQLNTMLWDRVNNGKEIESKEIQELFSDICQLDVMSCLEIDMAKKEFSVNNVLELNEMRKKYKITTLYNNEGKAATDEQMELYNEMLELKADDQDYKYFMKQNNLDGYYTKTVKPNFMEFTGNKKKKELIEEANEKIDFITYKSTMCFLEDIVNLEFKKIKAKKLTKEERTTFSKMFQTETKILTSKCDKNRVKNILELVKTYKTESKEIWSREIPQDSTEEEIKEINTKKYLDSLEKKNEYIDNISKLKVTAVDIKRIIKDLDAETQEVIRIRNEKKKAEGKEVDESKQYEIFGMGRSLLSILFKSHKEEFLKIFEEQKESIEAIRLKKKSEDINDKEIVKLYNLEFVVEKC